jgi:hypothetical protein
MVAGRSAASFLLPRGTRSAPGISAASARVAATSAADAAVVFELSPSKSGGWSESALHALADTSDGGFPNAGVIIGKSRNLFGTASTGGSFQ